MKKYILAIIIIIGLGLWWAYQSSRPEIIKIELPVAQDFDNFANENFNPELVVNDVPEELEVTEIPETADEIMEPEPIVKQINDVNLAVPFTSQAPTANWEQPFQDACEEASILMTVYYYQNKKMPSALEVESILNSMVDWQAEFMNGTHDITVEETGQLAQGFFDYQAKVIPNLTAEKIREFLRMGQPMIVPANGHILDNPYFSGDGPDYHMLVVKGFVGDKFITNDPGTKRGADFIYTEENLLAAIADWDKEKALTVGPKVGLILYKD